MKSSLTLTFDNETDLTAFVTNHFGSGQAVTPAIASDSMPAVSNHFGAPTTPGVQNPNATATPCGTVKVDRDGFPWDERIHAASKTQLKDLTWRKKTKLDPEFIAKVEAELLAANAAPMPQTPVMPPVDQQPVPTMPQTPVMPPVDQQPVPTMPQTPVMPPVDQQPVPTMPPVDQQPVPTMPPVDQQPVPTMPPVDQQPVPTMPQTPATMDFAAFMLHLSALMQKRDAAGQPLVNADYLAKITVEIADAFQTKLTAITDISAQPNMITYAIQLMQRDGVWG